MRCFAVLTEPLKLRTDAKLPDVQKPQDVYQEPQQLSERTQRFLSDEPKKEIALRANHNDDKIEEGQFIHVPSDQGLVAPTQEAPDFDQEPLPEVEESARVDVIPKQKLSTSSVPLEIGVKRGLKTPFFKF